MEAKDMNEMEPRIIEAAKRVFVRKGYEAATMSDVAAEVGIGRTALHYYYRTKEILFDAIFGQRQNQGNCFLHCCRTSIGFWMRRVRCWRKCR